MAESKWNDTHYVTAYELARSNVTNGAIAAQLGICELTLDKWLANRPALRDAIERGRRHTTGRTNEFTFQQYVFKQLPEELQKLWEEIMGIGYRSARGVEKIEALLTQRGTRARQHLFVYALTHANFNTSSALRMVNLSYRTLETWKTRDPDFALLMEEIHWHKENFFESALIRKVREGDVSAVLFAAKTQLRGRGYGESVKVEHSGTVYHKLEQPVDVGTLGLDKDTLKTILEAVRRNAPPPPDYDSPAPGAPASPIYTTARIVGPAQRQGA